MYKTLVCFTFQCRDGVLLEKRKQSVEVTTATSQFFKRMKFIIIMHYAFLLTYQQSTMKFCRDLRYIHTKIDSDNN